MAPLQLGVSWLGRCWPHVVVVEVQADPMPRSSLLDLLAEPAMEHLPADTLTTLSSFLTSHDAFNLSHMISWWLRYVADGSFWQRRLRSKKSWTKRFMVAPSLLFQGRHTGNNLELDSFTYLIDMKDEPSDFCLSSLSNESFSLDVWFSLLPATEDRCFGGVLYEKQSAERDCRPWPHYHQPIVVVNPSGDLYCSVPDAKPVVATNLQSKRWYHLALAYDFELQRQDVYLDGESVRFDVGALHQEWRYLVHEQVGTGCVTGGEDQFPYRGHLGWYGFHGIIDEFRVWQGVLSRDEIAELDGGGRLSSERLRGSLKLHTGKPRLDRRVKVRKVLCSRPTEAHEVKNLRLKL
jgi:hypothetical protein